MLKDLSYFFSFPDLAYRKWWDKRRGSFSLDKGFHPPFFQEVTLLLTFRCQLRCAMCPEWGEKGIFLGKEAQLQKEELPLQDWLNLVAALRAWKPAVVVLGGGEPLLFPHWQEVALALRAFTRVMVLTNGLRLEACATSLIESVDLLHISLDGNQEQHDRIRGKGSYARALAGIQKVAALRKEKGGAFQKKPRLRIAVTVVPRAPASYPELLREVFQKGADDVIFQHLMFIGRNELEKLFFPFDFRFWSGYELTLEGKEEMVLELQDFQKWLKTSPYKNRVQFHPPLREEEIAAFYNRNGFPLPRFQKGCLAPFLQMIVLPQGEVWLCPGYAVGNIREASLSEILRGEKAKKLYQALKKEFPFSVCSSCCYLYSYSI